MTRNIRKIVSILCAVAILLSLCAVSFTGSSSATVGAEDKVSYQTVWQTNKVELDLTFDGTTPGGIPLAFSGTKKYENGAFVYGNNGGSMGAAWLGKDASVTTISTSASYNPSNSPKANLFQLKANTTYKVTYKIAYRNDAPENLKVEWMAATDPYLSTSYAHGRGNVLASKATMIDGVDVKAPAPAGGTAYGDWQEETLIFTMGNADKYLGLRQNSSSGGQKIFKFDYIKIESGTVSTQYIWEALDNEYKFDYTNEANQTQVTDRMEVLWAGSAAKAHYSWYNWNRYMEVVSNKPNFTNAASYPGDPGFSAEGMLYQVGKDATITEPNVKFKAWANNAPIYDPDVGYAGTNNGYIRLRDEAQYIIAVKYKVTQVTTELQFGVAAMKAVDSGEMSILPGSVVTYTKNDVSDEWRTLYAYIDTSVDTAYADKFITLTAAVKGDTKWASIVVKSITVQEKRDVQNGVAVIETYNDGEKNVEFATPGVVYDLDVPSNTEYKGFAGWYTSSDFDEATKVDIANFKPVAGVNKLYAKWVNTNCAITFNVNGVRSEVKKMAVGETLPRAERPNGNLFFDGWYFDAKLTEKCEVVPEVGACELYAKFTGIYLPFNNKGYIAGTGTPELVVDPDDATNNVLKFSADNNSRPNFSLTAFDDVSASNFLLETNTKYYYSFKVKSAPGTTGGDITFYQGASPKGVGERTSLFSAGAVASNSSEDKNSDWTTYTGSFTTKDTFYLNRVNWAYQNQLYFTIYPGNGDKDGNGKIDEGETKKSATIYIDDIVIYKALDEAPDGASTVSFNTNGPVIPDMYGFAGDKLDLPTPKLGGYKFVEWCTDKKLTNAYTATVFGTEDITLYAKWETTDFIVDFENYNESGTLSRAKVLEIDGNWLMDYKSEYSSFTDYNTLYRAHVNKDGACYQVSVGGTYTITFDYKLSRGTLKYGAVTNGRFNGWTNPTVQKTAGSITGVTDEWKTVSFTFSVKNPNNHKDNWNYLSLGLGGDCDAQIDNVKILGATATANLYGSIILTFVPGEGSAVNPISGEPGEALGTLPTATRPGYAFNGWYADAELTTPFTATTFAEENMTAYAAWLLGKFDESYEEYPANVKAQGISGGYLLYDSKSANYDKSNIHSGATSLFRNGSSTGTKSVTLCRDAELKLTKGKQYTLSFYVKPTNVTAADGTINVIGLKTFTGIASPENTAVVTKVGELKANQWQRVDYTFTAQSDYVGISTTAGNDMYLDNFTIALKGYTGTTTGDSSVSPIILCMMVILAAGAMVVTGKKVFDK